jgi:hypothetical protein
MATVDTTHAMAILCSPTIFDYTKQLAECRCGWRSEWCVPQEEGRQLAIRLHWAHRMEVAPPRRYQRKRNVSAEIPAGAKYVGRPTKWGNPWKVDEAMTRADAVALYEMELVGAGALDQGNCAITPAMVRKELRGKDLVCWCPLDEPCHADVLLELANAD